MARSLENIQNEILTSIAANENLAPLNSTSKTAIWRLLMFIVAYSIFLLEQLFDTHTSEVNGIIDAKFPHRANWYRDKAKAFQYGFDLLPDTDKFNNVGFTDAQIEASKIIKYAAVTKNGGQILIKIASEVGGVLTPIAAPVKAAFDAYVDEIADCGVKYLVINNSPDLLLLNLRIYRDPLVLDANGQSILNGNYPVEDAINAFIKNLPFNGELVLAHLIDSLQAVEGVKIPHIVEVQTSAVDINTGAYTDTQPVDVKVIPGSGYFFTTTFDNISYVV